MGHDIVVLDDFFPHPGSSFRFEEFSRALERLSNLAVYSSGTALPHANETRPIEQVVAEHVDAHPQHAGRVVVLSKERFPQARLYYAVFLHIVVEHIDAIEKGGGGFVFTLYPGGGFAFDQPDGDALLRRVFGSLSFRHVVVTQALIRAYLLENGFCRDDQVTMIYGGVCPQGLFTRPPPKRRYGFGKPTLDLCFVANRYTPTGADKGYDLLVEAAKRLVGRIRDLRIHVVGRFDASIVDLGAAAEVFRFYGLQPAAFFSPFYAGIDAIVSPTRVSVLHPGAFDGFPTGCCVEAGLNEVAVICTDPLGLNADYTPGRDLIVVPSCSEAIVETLLGLARRPETLAALGEAARRRMLDLFDHERQVRPRLALLQRHAA